jgi:hypothetical protein
MYFNPNLDPTAPTRTGEPRKPVKGIETRLVFGKSIPKGGTVNDYAIRAFLDSVVLARFPAGFTVTESRGAWKGGQEDSFAVSVVYPDTDSARRDNGVKLEEIRRAYIDRFGQDSVLRIDSPVRFSFE